MPDTSTSGRLLLTTEVHHTATALRRVARRHGTHLSVLAPGVLELLDDSANIGTFLTAAGEDLTVVEAREVRCLAPSAGIVDDVLLGQAMRAPSLETAVARLIHADVWPLFDQEQSAFYSVYQPIVRVADGTVIGHEALLRARDSSGATVLPDRLFPAAEAVGAAGLLDRIGRTSAMRNARGWLGDALLFVNFSPTSIYRPDICLRTTELAAEEAGVSLDQVVFEVTESHRIRDVEHLDAVFAHYRARNARVALDDLGAGYSSLNLLIRLEPDVVKLDKTTIQGLPNAISSAVVSAVVRIARSYGGSVLAEGVETAEQARAVRELGVELGQGWFYGRPVRHDTLTLDRDQRVPVPTADRQSP